MLLSDQDHKMINLMTILYRNNNKWMKLTDLALFLNVSRKTLHSYIDKLQDMFSEYGDFYSAGSMAKVNLNTNFGLITAQKCFLDQSLPVRGLKATFFNPSIHKFDLSIELDVSESSIYRSVKDFNKSLKGIYDLYFSYTDLCFEGSEWEIQKFYINFFIETNPNPNNWIFEDYFSEEDANTIVRGASNYIKYKIYPAHFEYMKIAIAVAIIRLKQGFKIPLEDYNEEILKYVKELSSKDEIEKIIRKIFPNSAKDTYAIMYQIFAYFLSNDFFLFFLDNQGETKNLLKKEKQYKSFLKNAKYLCSKYNLTLDDPDELYYQIFTYFKFKISSIDATDFFINRSDYFLNYVKLFNVDFYKDLESMLQEYLDTFHPESNFEIKDLMYTIYTLWPNLLSQLLSYIRKTKALIISKHDYYYAKTIKTIIDLTASYPIEVDIYEGIEIDFEKIKNSSYDIIIVDFLVTEDLGDKLIFSFEQLPTIDRVQDLFKIICHRKINSITNANPKDFEEFLKIYNFINK